MKIYEETRRGDVLRDPENDVYFPKDVAHPFYRRFLEEQKAGKASIKPFSEEGAESQRAAARMRKLRGKGITQAQMLDALTQSVVNGDNSGLDRIREALK